MTLSKFLLAFVACTLDFLVSMSKTKIRLWKIYSMRNIGIKTFQYIQLDTLRWIENTLPIAKVSIHCFSRTSRSICPRPFRMFWQYIHNVTDEIDVSCTFPCFVVSVLTLGCISHIPDKKKRIEHLTSKDDSVLVQREQYKLINLLYIITALTKLYTYSGRIW